MLKNNFNNSLDELFKPKTIAIYEAKEKLYYFINGYKTFGFNRENLYLISPNENKVLGIDCYKSIEDIPTNTIDLFILAVRRELIIESLLEKIKKKEVKFIHFFSAGTGESDELGIKIEDNIRKILYKNNNKTRAIGPNCMGVYCPIGKNTYSPTFPQEPGNIGLIFHSGDLHSKMIIYSSFRYDLKFSKGVSVGNCVDLQISDFLKYFNNDEETDFVCVYFEGFSKYKEMEGKRLFNTLKNMKKPVLFLRGGRTNRAQAAVASHTGSLGTPQKMWQAVFTQTPTINAGDSLDDLIDRAYIFNDFFKKYRNISFEEQIKYYPNDKNALVILWSGGLGIIDTDVLTELGVKLPHFEGKEKEKLMEVYPLKIGSLSNPLDLPWIVATDLFSKICKAAITNKINVIFLETDSPLHWDKERFQQYYKNLLSIKKYADSKNKIFILILPEYPHRIRTKYYKKLLKDDFIVYPSIKRAAKSFLALYDYGKKLKSFITYSNNK
ncbi:MAG: CoA-binding protein [Promethearchaeota archaeon]